MPEHLFKVTITIAGPFLTKATAAGQPGVDTPAARDAVGHLMLPGSQVRGKLREAWDELAAASPTLFTPQIGVWLGQKSGSQEDLIKTASVDPQPGRLTFDDMLCHVDSKNQRTRICIDRYRVSVAQGALQVMEAPVESGESEVCEGTIRFQGAPDEAKEILPYLQAGLCWVTSYGSQKTIGFGRVLDTQVELVATPSATKSALQHSAGTRMGFSLQLLDALCIGKRRIAGNLFESEEFIPGGALKGAIARSASPELNANLHLVRIAHAFPSETQKRPMPIPLSIVSAPDSHDDIALYDVAAFDNPVLIHGEAPAFRIDWKSKAWDLATKHFALASLNRELRVRNAHDHDRRRAKDEALFAIENIVPNDGIRWHGFIDLSLIMEPTVRDAVRTELAAMLSTALHGLGKTKARVAWIWQSDGQPEPLVNSQSTPVNGLWTIVLQTPALLADPAAMSNPGSWNYTGQERLEQQYRVAWDGLSGGSLDLVRYLATESLAGGYYLHKRFQGEKAEYQPWLLTDAGSVFVLRANPGMDTTAQNKIGEWLQSGLSLPTWAKKRYAGAELSGDHWRRCPYLRENGYGEVVVNPAHGIVAPAPGQYEEVTVC
jgi:hypothetical protein